MSDFPEPDLPALARAQFDGAQVSCGECLPYHALWPYLRLTSCVGGLEADRAHLTPVLQELLDSTPKRVLIAGSADTGVTALVHHASGVMAMRHTIVVVDCCDTPLAACRRYGVRHGLQVRTVMSDLRSLDLVNQFDIIVGHSVLPFLDAIGRHTALTRLYEALAPGGQMLMTSRLSADAAPGSARVAPPVGASAALEAKLRNRLVELNLELPDPTDAFPDLVDKYSNGEFSRTHYARLEDLDGELQSAGFAVDRWIEAGFGTAFFGQGIVKSNARQGLVALTRAK